MFSKIHYFWQNNRFVHFDVEQKTKWLKCNI